ncbi:UDP-N-acetylglucosamine 1-carboxyvinyltransferase [Candidatus Saccharibacteria bacterium]|nr:UDP-N-acetylglucosamine 1-carboxyvinyltransferase [Candidatus Saccharibacteria bacterium]
MPKILKLRGGRPLSGHVRVQGAKNAATKMMIASLLTDEPVILANCPEIEDVSITAEICAHVGAIVSREGDVLTLHTPKIHGTKVTKLSSRNRISILALSPLLHRVGEAQVPIVGGDAIGPRPVNFHLDALAAMGAVIDEVDGTYIAKAPNGLRGAVITLPYPSVGATENVILAAVLAKGRTRIENAAIEPELVDMVKLLQQMGAIIEYGADRTLTIDGVSKLHGVSYRILPDRLEAASFANLAIATGGKIVVEGARQDELVSFLNTVRRMGATYEVSNGSITFSRGKGNKLTSIELETDTYPGFATDWQQPTVVSLTQAEGLSVIHETVYEDRFGYTEDLRRMGADIGVFAKCLGELPCRFRNHSEPHSAVIKGPTPLAATTITIPDIRAGMAQVIAAAVATGESTLEGVHHLERGYEFFWDKLRAVGADFTLE